MNIKLLSIILLVCLTVSIGCVKDDAFEDHEYGITDPAKQPKGVLFQQSRFDADNNQIPAIAGIVGADTSQTIQTLVKIAADGPVTSDLAVTIEANNDLVTPTGLTVLGSSYYQVPSTEVIIPAGEKFAYLSIIIPNASIIDPSVVYGLGFTITSVGTGYTIASNSKDLVVGIAIKNIYDGDYAVSGVRTRYNGGDESSGVLDQFPIDAVEAFATLDANTIVGQLADAGSGGTVALTINSDNTVTVSNPPGGAYPTLKNTPGTTSTYDEATQTIHFYASYLNASGFLRTVDETMVRN